MLSPPPGRGRHARDDDEALALRVANGDDQAFTLLYERHAGALYRYIVSMLREPEDARDVLQTTMMNAFRSLRARPREVAVKPWLFRIARNATISFARQRRPHSPISEELQGDALGVDGLHTRQRVRNVLGDLEDLPDRRRRLLLMREVQGLGYDEIADVLEISPGAARQGVHEVRATLVEAQRGRELECGEITARIADGDRRRVKGRAVRAHLTSCASCRTTLAESGAARGLAAVPAALVAVKSSIAQALGLSGLGGATGAASVFAGKGLGIGLALLTAGSLASGIAGSAGQPGPERGPAPAPRPSPYEVRTVEPAEPARFELSPGSERATPAGRDVGPVRDAAPPAGAASDASPGSDVSPTPAGASTTTGPSAGIADTASQDGATGHASSGTSAPSATEQTAYAPAATGGSQGKGESPPGHSESAPGHGGTPPGQGGTPPGQGQGQSGSGPGSSEAAPGHGGTPPGQGGTPPGQAGAQPGQSGSAPGNSESAPGHDGTPPEQGQTNPAGEADPPGQGGAPPGHSGEAPGQSGEAPGQSEEAPGQSGGNPGQGGGHKTEA